MVMCSVSVCWGLTANFYGLNVLDIPMSCPCMAWCVIITLPLLLVSCELFISFVAACFLLLFSPLVHAVFPVIPRCCTLCFGPLCSVLTICVYGDRLESRNCRDLRPAYTTYDTCKVFTVWILHCVRGCERCHPNLGHYQQGTRSQI